MLLYDNSEHVFNSTTKSEFIVTSEMKEMMEARNDREWAKLL